MRLNPGKYRARARWAKLAYTSKKDPQVAAELEILEEGFVGVTVKWFGQFTEKSEDRTLESLRLMGWNNDDLGNMTGIGDTDVEATIGEEEYQGKTYTKVQFIDPPGGSAQLKAPMSDEQASDFARRMRGAAIASRAKLGGTPALQQANTMQARTAAAGGGGQRYPNSAPHNAPPHTDDDIPF